MPVSKAAETVSVTPHRLWRVFDYWIGSAVEKDDISSVCEVGIDETSSKKGHDYVTVFVDMESRRVVDAQHGKDKEVVKKIVEKLELKSGDRKQIEQVSIDMSPAFISGALEMFKDIFDIQDSEEAKGYLGFWCDLAKESGIQPFMKFVAMIKAHWFGIVNYFDTKLTNGILEGINSKIQLLKRRARGYRKISNYINMIHFCCGKLDFDYPWYSS